MRTSPFAHLRLAGLLVLLCTCGVAAQRAAIKIAPHDQLTISVWNSGAKEESYSVKVPVDIDGTFQYPTLGRVPAGGLTTREVELDLKTRLDKILVSPQVTIEVEQTTTKSVVINGEVRAPAVYPFQGELTLFTLLTRAGSVTDVASDEAVIYRRSEDGSPAEPLRVDLYGLLNGDLMNSNVVLQDGDQIIVPKSPPVFVMGFVQTQGQVQVKRGTTVAQAISMAGGVTERGSKRGIKIQRMVDGKKKDIPVKNIDTDIVKPGDTIVVPARIL